MSNNLNDNSNGVVIILIALIPVLEKLSEMLSTILPPDYVPIAQSLLALAIAVAKFYRDRRKLK